MFHFVNTYFFSPLSLDTRRDLKYIDALLAGRLGKDQIICCQRVISSLQYEYKKIRFAGFNLLFCNTLCVSKSIYRHEKIRKALQLQ